MSDNKLLNLYPIDYPFETLVTRATGEKKKLDLTPDFQRKYKWDEEKASRFIESCFMRIPLPACYFAEDENKNHLVIDGVQRITTIIKYFNNEFQLSGLTVFKELNNKYFKDLDEELKNDLENYTIRCIILRNDNKKVLIRDIFSRLNQGSVILTPQEIRHAIYNGNFDSLLHELSEIEIIKKFGLGKDSTREKDGLETEEQVLRFFAMNNDLSDYEGDLKNYLDNFMEKNQSLSDDKIIELKNYFITTLDKCVSVFEDNVFSNPISKSSTGSLVYYDLIMWSFSKYSKDFLIKNKASLIKNFSELIINEKFKKTISGGTQNKGSILSRRKLWTDQMDLLNGQI